MEKTGIADMVGLSQHKAWLKSAKKEARILAWIFMQEEARSHIEHNLEHTKEMTGDDTHEFWLEVDTVFNAIVSGNTDEVEEFVHLLEFVNSLEPREKWIIPLLDDVPFQDFRVQLLTVIDGYKKV